MESYGRFIESKVSESHVAVRSRPTILTISSAEIVRYSIKKEETRLRLLSKTARLDSKSITKRIKI